MIFKRVGLLLMSIATAVGCVRYKPLPIVQAAVDQALLLPANEELQKRVAAYHNPLFRLERFDLSDGLNAGEAAVLAIVMNPSLRSLRDALVLSDAQLLQASVLPNPTLSLSLDEPFGSHSSGEVCGYAVGLEWEFTALIAQGAKIQAARAAGAQVRLDLAWKEWQTAEAARQAYFDVVLQRHQLSDAQQTDSQLRRIGDQFQSALKKGDVTLTNASAAAAAVRDADVALSSVRRDLRDAELTLNQSLGVPADTPIYLQGDPSLPLATGIAESTAFLKNLENRRIDLVALRRGYESQESSVRAAVLSQFPKISLGVSRTRDYGNFLTLGPAATVELPVFDRNQGNIAIEKASRTQLYDEYIARVFEARADIARAVAMIHSLNELIETQTHQVDELRLLMTTYESALHRGNLDVSTFYAAAVDLSQKQIDLAKLKQDVIHSVITLELASGASLEVLPADLANAPEATR